MDIIYFILGIIIGIIIGYIISNNKHHQQETQLMSQRDIFQTKLESITQQNQHAIESLNKQLQEERERNAQEKEEARKLFLYEKNELRTEYVRQLEIIRQQHKESLEQQSKLINEQIHHASEEILKQRSEELSQTNQQQLSAILTPLHENIKQMKEAVEKNDRDQSLSLERLDASIKANLKQAQEVGERADKLAQALTSENKTQGNFGELRLRQILENMGLEEGVQFEEQYTMKDSHGNFIKNDESGKKLIPDVILHFPYDRDVIIDSKMSFKAFEDYYNADSEDDKKDALNRHLTSVRTHVVELARKQYNNYIQEGHQKLDFVFMYVFSESALQLALTNDQNLWKWAYDQGVVISGSQNLYMMLRVLEMTWKQVKQVENQQRIMDTANLIIDRIQIYYERLQDVEKQFENTRKAFNKLNTITAPNGQSIETAANNLLKYGAKENPKRKYKLSKQNKLENISETEEEMNANQA